MSRTITARRAAHHGVPRDAMTQSPYSGKWVEVTAARCSGSHVDLMNTTGTWFLVDARQPIFRVRS